MNEWLTPLINNYLHYFGKTRKPVVAFSSGSPDNLIRVAKKIYDDEDLWFETDVRLVKLPDDEAPDIDVLQLTPSESSAIDIPKKTKALVILGSSDKDFIFNKGFQNVFANEAAEVWVSRKTQRG